MPTRLPFFPKDHPLQNCSDELRNRILRAQRNLVDIEFASSGELCQRVLEDLKLSVKVPTPLFREPVSKLADASFDLCWNFSLHYCGELIFLSRRFLFTQSI